MMCTVALVLLLDASGSIAAPDWQAQLGGTADALEHPAVVRLIEAGEGVAVTAIAFDFNTRELLPWRVLRGERDAVAYAAQLRMADRGGAGGTDIAGALRAGLAALDAAPCGADEAVIDLATDGEADSVTTRQARDAAIVAGVRINAIGVGAESASGWLREHAITPGGFAIAVSGWGDFAAAMRRKLSLEVATR
jgi:hypothetical protein